MLLGPVFHAELLTTARRARYYLARVIYGVALLTVLWSGYRTILLYASMRGSDQISINDMSLFAVSTFSSFTVLQVVAILLLTPALIAPVIASEKSRKTMHYLLSSQLNSAEIVLGKLGARVWLLVVLLASGAPVFSLLQLFGGLDAQRIIDTYLALAALLTFLGGLSILVSTVSSEPKRAVFFGYAAPVVFVAFPYVVKLLLFRFPTVERGVSEVFAWLWPLPRASLVTEPQTYNLGYEAEMRRQMIWMGVKGTLYGLGFMTLAIALVRPIGRREQKQRRAELRIDRRGRWHWRVLPRPAVGDDAMLWKERYTTRWSGVVKIASLLVHLFVATLIGCFLYELLRDSYREMVAHGYVSNDWESVRSQFNSFLRGTTTFLVGLWMLGTAAVAAGSITTEREADTWISLLSTPVTGAEILRAKVLGAVLRFKWLGFLLALLWLVGLAVGAIHPVGFLLAVVELPIFVGAAAALGVACSLESKTTTRALALTLGILVFLNGGYLIVKYNDDSYTRTQYAGGVAPFVMSESLASYPDVLRAGEKVSWYSYVYNRYGGSTEHTVPKSQLIRAMPAIATAIPLYLVLGLLLLSNAIYRFDRVSDRPKAPDDRASDLPASERRKQLAT